MVTSSNKPLLAQLPFATVHLNVLIPLLKPFTTEVGEFGLTNDPVPVIVLHVPIAGEVGAVAPMVAELFGRQTVWSAPALTGEPGL